MKCYLSTASVFMNGNPFLFEDDYRHKVDFKIFWLNNPIDSLLTLEIFLLTFK